jgi:hypothetical protein
MCYKCENTVEKLSARSLPGSYLPAVADKHPLAVHPVVNQKTKRSYFRNEICHQYETCDSIIHATAIESDPCENGLMISLVTTTLARRNQRAWYLRKTRDLPAKLGPSNEN